MSKDQFSASPKGILSRLGSWGHILPLMIVSAGLVGIILWAGLIVYGDISEAVLSRQFLISAFGIGLVGFAGFISIAAYHALNRAKQQETEALQHAGRARSELELAQAMLKAEPQMLMMWDDKGEAKLVIHTLDTDTGIPFHFAETLYFENWLERASALELRTALERLFEHGTSFTLSIRTLSEHYLEADGRTTGGTPILRLRNLAGSVNDITMLYEERRQLHRMVEEQMSLLNMLPLPVWLRDEYGKLDWVNSAYLETVEAGSVENVKLGQIELLELRQRKEIASSLADGQTYNARLHTVIGGKRRAFDTIAIPVGERSGGIAMDVGDIETAQGQLELVVETHTRTLDRVATAIAIFGPAQDLTFFNQAYLDLFSLDKDWLREGPEDGEILDQLRLMRLLPEQADYRAWRETQLQCYASLENREDWWHLPDGRTIHVVQEQRSDGGVTHLYDDVTERLAMESRYNELIGFQSETLDHLAEGVGVFAADGRLRLHNPAFRDIWQLDEKMLNCRPHIEEVIHYCRNLYNDPSWDEIRRVITSISEQRYAINGEIIRDDGKVIAYAALPMPDGSTLLTYVDVTATRRMERVLRERNEALIAADQLKSAFISNVSYELRSPLTNIIGFSELLASPKFGELNDRQREYLNDIRSSSDNLLAIIDDILDLATIDAGTLELNVEEIEVAKLIKAASLAVQDRLKQQQVTLDVTIAQNIKTFFGDEKRITQVLYNLLSNAIGFSERSSQITINCEQENSTIIFAIADSGCGIPLEEQAEVFNRFESSTRGSNHRGAGLGLPLVKSLVELHGGEIALVSVPDQGTTVTVRLPMQGLKTGQNNQDQSGAESVSSEVDTARDAA